MDPSGYVIGLAAGLAIGISVGLAIKGKQKPFSELSAREKKIITAAISAACVLLLAGVAVFLFLTLS